jgi:hypothetical protein
MRSNVPMYIQTCTRHCVRTHLRVFDRSASSHTHIHAHMRSNLLTYVRTHVSLHTHAQHKYGRTYLCTFGYRPCVNCFRSHFSPFPPLFPSRRTVPETHLWFSPPKNPKPPLPPIFPHKPETHFTQIPPFFYFIFCSIKGRNPL